MYQSDQDIILLLTIVPVSQGPIVKMFIHNESLCALF